MLNKTVYQYNSSTNNEFNINTTNESNPLGINTHFFSIINAYNQNFTQSPAGKNVYPPGRHSGKGTEETADEELKADRLFANVALFKKHPESLATAQPGKKITITTAGQSLSIPTKKIALPGGHQVYVAVVGGRWLVSDGEIYHIDNLVCPSPSWQDSLACLLEHLAGVVRGYQAAHFFRGTPQAAPTPDGAYPAGAHPASPLQRHPRATAAISQQPPEALPLLPDPLDKKNDDNEKDYICETNLHIANHGARELYSLIKQQYIPLAKDKIYSLGWMSELNIFLYDKITELFNDASYLNNIVQFADIIMIKKHIENNIEKCIKAENTKKPNSFSEDYFLEQRIVADFFPFFSMKIEEAIGEINFKTLRDLIEFKNGVSYHDAKKNLLQLIKESTSTDEKTYREQYSLLILMQEAQQKYERLLISDSIPLLDRLIYFNTREIYIDLLDEQPKNLRRIFIKRFLYYVFEYSRSNGLSIQSNYLIIPGELTEYSGLFDALEPPLSEDEIAELVANQIVDFIHGSDKYNPHIDRLIRDIAFYRSDTGKHWQELSLQPYKDTLKHLEQSASTNLNRLDNPLYTQNPRWINDLFDQIKYDKECILLLSFLEKLQTYLVDIVSEHQQEEVLLGSKTEEQRLAEAKIQAMIMAFPGDCSSMSKQEIITEYFHRVTTGDIELLLRAALYWYIDFNHIQLHQLGSLDSLYIIKDFQEAKKMIAQGFETRSAENFKKIFELKPSSEFISAKAFYDQFIYYKDYSLQQEARQFTYKILSRSELDYLDMIYPPKEIYTFKIFSRNYVQNSLSPNSDVYSPNNNFGTFSLIRTYSQKLIIACSLFSAPFIKEITTVPGNDLLSYIFDEHKKTNFNLNWINRRKIPVTADDLLELFDIQYDSTKLRISPLSLFLIEPEDNIASEPRPDYVLVAGKGKDDYNTMMEILDYWNAQTLKEIAEQLKISLRERKWWQEILALIPFYEILWKYSNDDDNQFNGIEIIFDTFDLVFIFAQLTKNTAKGTSVLYKRLLNIANIDSMPIKQLNRIISQKLIEELPNIARKSSGTIFTSLLEYINPLPIHSIFSKKIKNHLATNMPTVISWVSNFILNNMEKRMTKFILWSADIDRNLLSQKNNDGTFILNQGQGTTQNFIEINDYFFQVIWDAAIKSWRVVKPTEVINSNYAVPLYRNDKGKWIASYFLDNDRFPVSARSGRRNRHVNEELDIISMEPLRSISFPKDRHKDNKWLYIYMLELLINEYMPHMKTLFDQSSDISKMLTDLVESLTDKSKFFEVFSQKHDENAHILLHHFLEELSLDSGVKVAYRMLRLWENEHDHTPVDHIVLVLKIKQNDYILDMSHLRPYGAGLIEDRQVFNEQEWALLIKKNIRKGLSLIKYKDFSKIKSAMAFPYLEAGHPGKYVKGAFLLREPIWHKTIAIKYYYRYVKETSPSDYKQAPSILTATRTLISSYGHLHRLQKSHNLNCTFPFLILKEAKILDNHDAEEMQKKVSRAMGQRDSSQEYMSSSVELIETDDLLKLKAGKLLAVFYDDFFLSHLMLSVGDGRFAGFGNNLFNPVFETGPSIILAEEMGTFADGKLMVRNTEEQYTLLAGNPFNAPVNESVMSDKLAFQTIAKNSPYVEDIIENARFAAREKTLTQDCWALQASPNNTELMTLRMAAVPQGIYPLDAREMTHVIRGLVYANSNLPDLSLVRCIELITIFDGFAVMSHKGQILANDLRIDIQLCPYLETDGIRQRHPQWFTRFSPVAAKIEGPWSAPTHTHRSTENSSGHGKSKRLADMVEMLIMIRKSLDNARIKRNVNLLPAILSDLARLIIRDMNFYDFTGLYQHQLDKDAEEKIYVILREYQDYISEGDEYFLQCYFDILLAVANFRLLAESLYPMPLLSTNNTLPLWPYT